MTKKELKISWTEYSSIEELSATDRELCREAVKAMELSYAPYSKFNVGAALRMSDGRIFKGANQENNAYPSGLCAERTTMFYAHAHRDGAFFESLAIAAGQGGKLCEDPATPCGDCRQVMAEFQKQGGHRMSILLIGASSIWKFDSVDSLLPFIFDSL